MSRIVSLNKINRLVKDSYTSFIKRKRSRVRKEKVIDKSLVLKKPDFRIKKRKKKTNIRFTNTSSQFNYLKKNTRLGSVKSNISHKISKKVKNKENNSESLSMHHLLKIKRKRTKKAFSHLTNFYETLNKKKGGYNGTIKYKVMPRKINNYKSCLLYTSPSPRDGLLSRMPSSA